MGIFVVDDEPDVETLFRQQLRRELRDGRFNLEFARSGTEALTKLGGGERKNVILLVTVINMPGMSGLDLLTRIGTEHPKLPVLMITAYGDQDTRRVAFERGADGLLTRPLDFRVLRQEIESRASAACGQEDEDGQNPGR